MKGEEEERKMRKAKKGIGGEVKIRWGKGKGGLEINAV